MTKAIVAVAKWVEDNSTATFVDILYWFSMAITFVCELSAVTILVAIFEGKLDDPEAWMAVWFFGVTGGIVWIVGHRST